LFGVCEPTGATRLDPAGPAAIAVGPMNMMFQGLIGGLIGHDLVRA
jgi:hypothetical protein